MPLTPGEIQEVLNLGHELRHVEFKNHGDRTDKSYQAIIARAVMAMGNLPDGGHVILGVDDTRGMLTPIGVTEEQSAQWTDHDCVADILARFSDPTPVVHIEVVQVGEVRLVDIHVEPFAETPYLCKADSEHVLQKGRMYVRTTGKAETGNPSHHELREVLDRAAAQRVRSLLAMLGESGIATAAQTPDARQLYAKERDAIVDDRDRWRSTTSATGWFLWPPDVYKSARVPRADLERIIEASTVRLRGWPVPLLDRGNPLHGHRYIGGETEDDRHVEGWRFFTSGQFFEKRLFSAEALGRREKDAPSVVDIWDIVFHTTEIYSLAARLSEQVPDVAAMTVRLALGGLFETQLRSEPERELHQVYRTDESLIEVQATISVAQLLARPSDLAVDAAIEILSAFGLTISRGVLADYQETLLRRARGLS